MEDSLVLVALTSATDRPATRIIASKAVPAPIGGGTDNCPVRNDTMPVAASASTNGIDVSMSAFVTAILSFPPFHGLLFDDKNPATADMITKTRVAKTST